jgi:hypothetical protein
VSEDFDFIDKYLEYTASTPSPEIYRLWCGISTLAGAMASKTLPSSVYVLSAQGGKYNASFVFYVYNPISQPAPVPGNNKGNITTSIPDDTSGGSGTGGGEGDNGGGTGTGDGGNTGNGDNGGGTIPSTGGGGTELPHTGGDPIDLILGATMFFGVGAGAMVAGRRREYLGRHTSR